MPERSWSGVSPFRWAGSTTVTHHQFFEAPARLRSGPGSTRELAARTRRAVQSSVYVADVLGVAKRRQGAVGLATYPAHGQCRLAREAARRDPPGGGFFHLGQARSATR